VLDNAVRHAAHRIEVHLWESRLAPVIEVRDDGPGVAAGSEERIFARFSSLDGLGGSGLGLAIARGYMERQGGELVYEDGGFSLRLPGPSRARRTAESDLRPPASPRPTTGSPRSGIRSGGWYPRGPRRA